MSSMVIGILKCEGDLSVYTPDSVPSDPILRELVEDLKVAADAEWGIEAVEPEVVANGRMLYDIRVNGKSAGYFALRTFADTYGKTVFTVPQLIEHGTEDIVDAASEKYDGQIYVIPLFGELEDAT